MASSLNLSLTDELREFVDKNCGDGTLYATPSEFVRDLIRRQKLQQDAEAVRVGILAGYQDLLAGRTVALEGNLGSVLEKAKK